MGSMRSCELHEFPPFAPPVFNFSTYAAFGDGLGIGPRNCSQACARRVKDFVLRQAIAWRILSGVLLLERTISGPPAFAVNGCAPKGARGRYYHEH